MSLFSGLSRPMKAAGLALVGVAVIAAVIGGITLTSGGGDSDTATPPGTTPTTSDGATPPSSEPQGTPPASSPPASSAPPSSAPASSAPPASQPGQTGKPGPGQPGGDQQAAHKWVTVRVYNNSLIQGLAERAANDFRASGWNVTEVGPHQGKLPKSAAYYRPGTDEEAAAKALALEFGIEAQPRFEGIQNAAAGVIVILTKDYDENDKSGGS
ncbi:LytR C-terminal domain-containing protein [Amycolatopsis thailandensis]|uniref:Glycoprotein n=1 Tax=Amycolatopsis thailandensis TaxID=589330 RepID=A0A229RXL3_9PSEU|nr:LytR C-terminal domain-containing protein [Amycolatopsis thailandensis]OXM51219.1 glycoprotein [Amycolatopsis thailandensis]